MASPNTNCIYNPEPKETKMTKRVFNADNESDVKELFALIDTMFDGVRVIVNSGSKCHLQIYTKDHSQTIIHTHALSFEINWNGKSEIERPVEIKKGDWCLFCDEKESFLNLDNAVVAKYECYVYNKYHKSNLGSTWEYCKKLTKSEWKKIGKANGLR